MKTTYGIILAIVFVFCGFDIHPILGQSDSTKQTNDETGGLDDPTIIIGVVSVIVTVLVSVVAVPLTTKRIKIQEMRTNKVWELYNEFYSKEFRLTRMIVRTEIYRNEDKNKINRIILGYLESRIGEQFNPKYDDVFGSSDESNESEESPEKISEQFTHLEILLYFWTKLDLSLRNKHVDEKLSYKVFYYMFWWWEMFLVPFSELYIKSWEKIEKDKRPPKPLWIESIQNLAEFFKEGKYPRS